MDNKPKSKTRTDTLRRKLRESSCDFGVLKDFLARHHNHNKYAISSKPYCQKKPERLRK